jgi:hypothetical protein
MRNATDPSSSALPGLIMLYKLYSGWVKMCLPDTLTRAEVSGRELRT